MKNFSYPLLAVSLTLILATHNAYAINAVIEKEAPTSTTQLAIVPFANTDITNIVSNDLTHLGQLSTTTNLPEQPHSSGEVNLTAWQQLGVPYLVVGSNASNGGNSVVGFEVINVTKNQNLGKFSQPMRGDINGKRMAGHKIADKVYELLTGIKGDFSGKIAYVLENGVGKNKISRLMLMDVDGANPTLLAQIKGSIISLAGSHDGRKLVFSVISDSYPTVNILDIPSKSISLISPPKTNSTGGSFSPDDSRILFSSDKDSVTTGIYLTSPSGGSWQRITNLTGNGKGMDISPSWADSGAFYYVSDPAGNNKPQIFRYSFAAGNAQAVTGAGGYNADVHVSNDGKKIAYLANTNQGVVRVEGGGVTSVNNYGLSEAANFSPNSQHMVYSSGRSVIISANGMSSSIDPAKTGGGTGIIHKPVWLKAIE